VTSCKEKQWRENKKQEAGKTNTKGTTDRQTNSTRQAREKKRRQEKREADRFNQVLRFSWQGGKTKTDVEGGRLGDRPVGCMWKINNAEREREREREEGKHVTVYLWTLPFIHPSIHPSTQSLFGRSSKSGVGQGPLQGRSVDRFPVLLINLLVVLIIFQSDLPPSHTPIVCLSVWTASRSRLFIHS